MGDSIYDKARLLVASQGLQGCTVSHVEDYIRSSLSNGTSQSGPDEAGSSTGQKTNSGGDRSALNAVWYRLLECEDIIIAIPGQASVVNAETTTSAYQLTPSELRGRFGAAVKMVAHPDLTFKELVMSSVRDSKLTNRNYEVLQYIAAAGHDGRTSTDIGAKFEIDQKSVFHVLKILGGLNLVVKTKAIIDKRALSIVNHVKFPLLSKTPVQSAVLSGKIVPEMWSQERALFMTAVQHHLSKSTRRTNIRHDLFALMVQGEVPANGRKRFQHILRDMVEEKLVEYGQWTDFPDHDDEESAEWVQDRDGQELRLLRSPNGVVINAVEANGEEDDDVDGAIGNTQSAFPYHTLEQSIVKLIADSPEGILSTDLATGVGALRPNLIGKRTQEISETRHPDHLSHLSIVRLVDRNHRARVNRWFSVRHWRSHKRTDPALENLILPYEQISIQAGGFSSLTKQSLVQDISRWVASLYHVGRSGPMSQKQQLSVSKREVVRKRGRPRKDGSAARSSGPNSIRNKRRRKDSSDEEEEESAISESEEASEIDLESSSDGAEAVSDEEDGGPSKTSKAQPIRASTRRSLGMSTRASTNHLADTQVEVAIPAKASEPSTEEEPIPRSATPPTRAATAPVMESSNDVAKGEQTSDIQFSTVSTQPATSVSTKKCGQLYGVNLAARRYQGSLKRILNLHDQVIERDALYAQFQRTHSSGSKPVMGQVDRKTIRRTIDQLLEENFIRQFDYEKTAHDKTKTVQVIVRADVSDEEARRKLRNRLDTQLANEMTAQLVLQDDDNTDDVKAKKRRFRIDDLNLLNPGLVRQKLLQTDHDLCAWWYGYLPGRARRVSTFHLWLIEKGYDRRPHFKLQEIFAELDLGLVRAVHGVTQFGDFYNNLFMQEGSESKPISSIGPLLAARNAIEQTVANLLDDLLSLSLVYKINPKSIAEADPRLGALMSLAPVAPMLAHDPAEFRQLGTCSIRDYTSALQWWRIIEAQCQGSFANTGDWPKPWTNERKQTVIWRNIDWVRGSEPWSFIALPSERQLNLMKRFLMQEAQRSIIDEQSIDQVALGCVTIPAFVQEKLSKLIASNHIDQDRTSSSLWTERDWKTGERRLPTAIQVTTAIPRSGGYSGLNRRDGREADKVVQRELTKVTYANQVRRRELFEQKEVASKVKASMAQLVKSPRAAAPATTKRDKGQSEEGTLVYLTAAAELKAGPAFDDFSEDFFKTFCHFFPHRSPSAVQRTVLSHLLDTEGYQNYNCIKMSWVKSKLLDQVDLSGSLEQLEDLLQDPALLKPHLFASGPAVVRPVFPAELDDTWDIRDVEEGLTSIQKADGSVQDEDFWASCLSVEQAPLRCDANVIEGDAYFSVVKMMLSTGTDQTNAVLISQFNREQKSKMQSTLGAAQAFGLIDLHARDLIRPAPDDRNTVYLTPQFWQKIDHSGHSNLDVCRALEQLSLQQPFEKSIAPSPGQVSAIGRLLSRDALDCEIDTAVNRKHRETHSARRSKDDKSIEVGLRLSTTVSAETISIPAPQPRQTVDRSNGEFVVKVVGEDGQLSTESLAPRFWFNVHGKVSMENWTRCVKGMASFIQHHGGIGQSRLYDHYRTVLSQVEVDEVVSALLESGYIHLCRAQTVVPLSEWHTHSPQLSLLLPVDRLVGL